MLAENFGDTLEWLHDKEIQNAEADEIALALIEKTVEIKKFDFKKDVPNRKFDIVLCIESLQVADNQEDLNRLTENAASLVRNGGKLIGLSWRYNARTDLTDNLIAMKYDGLLNPDIQSFETAFNKPVCESKNWQILQRLILTTITQ